MNDDAIVEQVLSGQTKRFGLLVTRHKDRIYRFILKQVGNLTEAEDLTQDTFLEAYRCLSTYQKKSKFSTWMYGIAVNICRNHIGRSAHRRYRFLPAEVLLQVSCEKPSPLACCENMETIVALIQAINALPNKERETMILVSMEDFSYEETAQILDIPVGTVKSRMFQARKRLKTALNIAAYRL